MWYSVCVSSSSGVCGIVSSSSGVCGIVSSSSGVCGIVSVCLVVQVWVV